LPTSRPCTPRRPTPTPPPDGPPREAVRLRAAAHPALDLLSPPPPRFRLLPVVIYSVSALVRDIRTCQDPAGWRKFASTAGGVNAAVTSGSRAP
jgi:hypothetical protein